MNSNNTTHSTGTVSASSLDGASVSIAEGSSSTPTSNDDMITSEVPWIFSSINSAARLSTWVCTEDVFSIHWLANVSADAPMFLFPVDVDNDGWPDPLARCTTGKEWKQVLPWFQSSMDCLGWLFTFPLSVKWGHVSEPNHVALDGTIHPKEDMPQVHLKSTQFGIVQCIEDYIGKSCFILALLIVYIDKLHCTDSFNPANKYTVPTHLVPANLLDHWVHI